jgi:hypothetical protein
MPVGETHRPIPRAFLERVSRALLVRILSPHDAALRAHAVSIEALAATEQKDRSQVDALVSLLLASPPELHLLRDDVCAIADVATIHERLLEKDTDRLLDPELGAEDCAATLFLDRRAKFDEARPHSGSTEGRVYATFESKSPRALPDDPARHRAFDDAMRAELAGRGRSSLFKRHVAPPRGAERHMELVYGKVAAAHDLVGKVDGGSHEITAQVTQRSTERARVVFHDDTLRLDVAGPNWMKEVVRRIFGEAYFDDAEHFHGAEVISLEPLGAGLESALRCDDVPGLDRVTIKQLSVDIGADNWITATSKNDCQREPAAPWVLKMLAEGAGAEATFILKPKFKPRVTMLKVCTPGKLEFARTDPRVVRVVREWLAARGYMKMPEHMLASEGSEGGDA